MKYIFLFLMLFTHVNCAGQNDKLTAEPEVVDSAYIAANYDKFEYRIAMRDGVRLFTSVYVPKDKNEKYPIMLNRTPYSAAPYGEGKFKPAIGPSPLFTAEKFIFAFQDVRGKFMSEGEFVNVRPFIPKKPDSSYTDESTDTYDTIEWLINNIEGNNGRAGMWGTSYPGYYSAYGSIDAHPALKAVSPQAPIADWFWDDFHHHGAVFLPHTFNFFSVFGKERKELATEWGPGFNHGTSDGYKFFLELGSLKNVNEKYFKDSIQFWNEFTEHPNYDDYWKARNLRPHLKNIKPAVMTVGGWYDAEDLFGALKVYEAYEKQNEEIYNILVMGPWRHGGWWRDNGTFLGKVWFGDDPASSVFYQKNIEFPFFMHFLKDKAAPDLPEAYIFETGTNEWRKFDEWPPRDVNERNLYFTNDGGLSETRGLTEEFNEFISDPSKPVPYTEEITIGMTREYMTDDQRFAARRPDVLVYETPPLDKDITIAGPITAALRVSTTGTDADWIVKIIDVYPDDHPQYPHNSAKDVMGGYQQMVRSEVIRGRFRNSYEKPEPFLPGKVTEVNLPLQDVLHTFKKGHRIMIHVQSTWFPLVDRNPQKYVDNIFEAEESDFIKAAHRVYNSSSIKFTTLP